MKTIEINISSARNIEDAMDKAIEYADNESYSKDAGRGDQTHRVSKVTFKTLEVSIEYRDNHWVYKFEAEMEEL